MSSHSNDISMRSPSSSSSSSNTSSLFPPYSSVSSSSSTPASTSPSIHPLSLVHPSTHSPQTLKLVAISITQHLIDYVVDRVIETVDHAMSRESTLLPASSSSKPTSLPTRPRSDVQKKFNVFATTVITRAEITTPTLLLALIYIRRARPHIHIALEEWALERVFLGALIVASKYANDSTLKNVHWALCTGVFGKRDVGRIEREFLAVLDWELNVCENEVLALWEGLEWAVKEQERVDRENQQKLEKERLRQLDLLERQREQQEQQRQQKPASKFFLYSGGDRQRKSATEHMQVPPALPTRPRNHKRSNPPAPLAVKVTTTTTTQQPSTLAVPSRMRGHSPSSSSMSSSSSTSSDSPSPATPEDFQTQYIVIEDGGADHDMDVSGEEIPQKKRGFGATTMDLLKSFPFPGHHSHSSQQLPSKRHDREISQPHPYAYTISNYQQYQPRHPRYATEESQRPMKRLPCRAAS